MKIIRKNISILPDKSLMPKIGQTGYSIAQAISELVDNSIDARFPDKILTVEIRVDSDGDLIEVADDGMGMNEKTASNSIKLAHSDKKDKLGEFGLGLKTASTSLGKYFQIKTTQKGSDKEYLIEFDEEEWMNIGDWNKYPMQIKTGVARNNSGTTVLIKKLKIRVHPNLPGNIRKELATRFAPFIQSGELRIRVNTKWCEPVPLELQKEYFKPDGKETFEITLESGYKIWGWRGLLQKGSDNDRYGFRVFRRGRLITQNAKIGFNPHPEARQIIGELHMDHVPVTHNKREFMQESPLYQEVIKEDGAFWNYMRDLVREARSSMRKKKIDQLTISKMDVMKDNIMQAIKKLPELKEYAFPDLEKKVRANKNKNDGETDLDIEKRDQRDLVTVEETPQATNERTRRPRKIHESKQYFITIKGKKFKFEHHFIDLKTEDVLKEKTIDPVAGIVVYTNIAFPAYEISKDPISYGSWNIAESIAEVMVEENNRSLTEVNRIRDLILQKSSALTRDLNEMEDNKKTAEKKLGEYVKLQEKVKAVEQRYLTQNTY